MRAVLQRVASASVAVAGATIAEIGKGFLVLLGVGRQDTVADAAFLAAKTLHVRVFEDAGGLMNYSIRDIGAEVLVVSQFTLYGDCRKGRRPSFSGAADSAQAKELYEYYIAELAVSGLPVKSGIFQAMMDVSLVNTGPVTLLLDSAKLF